MRRIFALLFLFVVLVAEQANAQSEQRMRTIRRVSNSVTEKLAQQNNAISAASDFSVVGTNSTTAGATTLAQTLAGTGVTVSNAKLNCYYGAGIGAGAGTFSYSGSTLGISSGIVLTTGLVSDIGHTAQILNEATGNNTSDANLNSLVVTTPPTTFYDVCILTFNFVPICNSISITYEFGSSEYDGYQCSQYNDAFGLFLSGPDPTTGLNYAAHTNIATLPNGQAVSINNVHDGVKDGNCGCNTATCVATNSAYYIPNYTVAGSDIAYEGLTTAITSTAAVTPCQTYTMEVAIGDAGDEGYDSGVFLKSNALSCPSNVASATSPANCGGSTGSASVTVTNYTGTPTYTWSPGGQTTSSISNQAAGTYTCTVGLTQCGVVHTQSITAVISPTTTPVTIAVNSATICTGGSVTLTASGTATNYTWTPATNLSTTTGSVVIANPTTSQTYTVKGASGTCTNTATSVVTVKSALASASSSTICAGQQTATITATGASTYTWTGGSITGNTTSSPTVSPTSTTIYTVNATAANTCTATATGTITVNTPATLTVTSNSICNGTGPATLGVTGASTYTWTGGGITGSHSTTPSDNPASTTIYTVNGTDAHACKATGTGTINVISTPTISVNSGAICKGQTSLTLTATSNATSFVWSPGTGLSATTGSAVVATPTATQSYTIVGTAGTCTVSTTTTVTVHNTPTLTTTSSTICSGQQTGTVTANGASTYTWTGGSITGNITSNPTATPTSTTIYTVNASDVNTCTATATATITVNTPPTLTVTSDAICNGAGPATLGVTGASTYTWTGGGITGSNSTAPSDNPAVPTTYTVNGTDAHSCTATATGMINVISTPTISVNSGSICKGQTSLTLTVNSNAASFAWSPGTGLSATTGSAVVATPTATQSYTIVGTAGTCTVSTTATVTVNTPANVTTTSSTICLGQQTGTVTASGSNTYTWTGGGITGNTTSNPTATPTSTTVYTVNASDVNTCTATATATITVNTPPTLTVTSNSICDGAGPASLGVTGASTYTWTGGGITGSNSTAPSDNPAVPTTYTVNGTDAHSCTATATGTINVISTPTISVNSGSICKGQTSLTLTVNSSATGFVWSPTTGLSATTGSAVVATPTATQSYTIVGTAGTCTVSTTATVTVNTPANVTTTSSTICLGQQTGTVTASGSNTYTWTGGGITGNTTSNPTDNPASLTIYTVNATDVNTCTATATATITVNSLPIVSVSSSTICLGQQTATLTAGGASTYSWTTGLSATTGSTVTGSPPATTPYTVTGTDVNGCTGTAVATINVISTPTITVVGGAMCLGQQTVALTANSNAASFVWSPAAGLSTTTGSSVMANPTTVGPNTYTIVATAGSCTVSTTATVTVNPLPVPTASANVPCETENPLNLTSAPAGTYTYSWSGPNAFTSTAQNPSITTFSNVTQAVAGTYSVLVTDNNSCYNTATVTVVVNPKPVITATGATVCVGQTINLTSSGAGATGNYSWNGANSYTSGQQSPSIPIATTGMTGAYTVVGYDANNCSGGASVQVQVNPTPTISIANSGPMCVGQETTTLTASSSNVGTTYSWTPATALSATTGSVVVANPTPAGTYTYLVTGTDANTCVGTFSTSVLVNPLPIIIVSSGTICLGQQTATLTAASTNTLTTYNWLPATGLSSATGSLVTGTPTITTSYVITGTDGNGCTNTGNASIVVNALPIITATSGTICIGQTVNLIAGGGQIYTWSPTTGLTPSIGSVVAANPTSTQSYVVTGADVYGCVNTASCSVVVYNLPNVTVTSGTICVGQQTTTLTASGASTYTWSPSTGLSSSTGASVNGFPTTIGVNVYTVTATDAHRCVDTAITSILVNGLPTVAINTVSPECVPFCTPITANPTPATGTYSYNWNFGNGQTLTASNPATSSCYTVAGTFAVSLLITDTNGCTTTASTPVYALSIPVAAFDYSPQPITILAPEVQFTNTSTPGLPFQNWNFGDVYTINSHDTSSVNNPSHTYAEVGTYSVTLTVSTANGCSATIVEQIIVNDAYALYVPNAFSPNGDGKNEIFLAEGEGIVDFQLYIFDRWGLLLFYSNDITKGWNGTKDGGTVMVQEDVYVWKIQATDITNKSKSLHGTVTLLK